MYVLIAIFVMSAKTCHEIGDVGIRAIAMFDNSVGSMGLKSAKS